MNDFFNKLGGLITSDRGQDISSGLLSQSGWTTGAPPTLGSAFGNAMQFANDREGQRMSLQGKREQLEAEKQARDAQKRQRDAQQELQTLMQVPPSIRNPNAPEMMQGLLMEAAPDQMMEGLLAQQFPQAPNLPSSAQEFQFGQSLPPEMQAAYQAQLNPVNPNEQMAGQLAAMSIQDKFDERALSTAARETLSRTRSTGRSRGIDEISHLTDLLEETQGTQIEPGILAQTIGDGNALIAALGNVAGIDATQAKKRATQYGVMNKSFDRLITRILPDTFTNSTFEFIKGQNAGMAQQPGTNAEVLKMTVQQMLDDDFNEDGSYDLDQEAAEQLMQRLDQIVNQSMGGSAPLPANFILD